MKRVLCSHLARVGPGTYQGAAVWSCVAPASQQLGSTAEQIRGYASKTAGSRDEAEGVKPMDRGQRYGVRLKQRSPQLFQRMRAILGHHDLPGSGTGSGSRQTGTSGTQSGPQVKKVTINLLQTLRYLDLPSELKHRLLHYRTISLNRELEESHAAAARLMSDLKADPASTHQGTTAPRSLLSRKQGQ
eukprot:CAMPEP_0119107032 /NCGR_PEP_ID=MMETSP1180-20130426/7912_1 /TAXON_ID=3052 ORGANISM="Chlamydomonas cf sp, Strain CCMP681" /NCGR_SAMPLE_ID=MMETSP1180 /ASSEMBLY_ACC=CAM_ASM_000741 /LENGTH=187 /DNA_ID=CAMNT_0007092457 /DNA_START=44 /DNA_END=607 /DNA_ORIENTATION=+